jgi:hypothetical protein
MYEDKNLGNSSGFNIYFYFVQQTKRNRGNSINLTNLLVLECLFGSEKSVFSRGSGPPNGGASGMESSKATGSSFNLSDILPKLMERLDDMK